MAANTKIAWCDSTLNWWEGCTKITEGCRFCYAEARDKRFTGGKLWGKGAPRRQLQVCGSLVAAEIDRIQRKLAKEGKV